MERRLAQNKKAEQEEKMRQMAQKARYDLGFQTSFFRTFLPQS